MGLDTRPGMGYLLPVNVNGQTPAESSAISDRPIEERRGVVEL